MTGDDGLEERDFTRGEWSQKLRVAPGVDLEALAVTFSIGAEPAAFIWVDMHTAPAKGDIVLGRALGLTDGVAYKVDGRGWIEHNLVNIVLAPIPDGEVTQ